eukprot:1664847-Rhodomonas_salina.1
MSLSRGKRLRSVGDDDEIEDLTIAEETESESASADFVVEQTAGSFFNPLPPNQIEEAMVDRYCGLSNLIEEDLYSIARR